MAKLVAIILGLAVMYFTSSPKHGNFIFSIVLLAIKYWPITLILIFVGHCIDKWNGESERRPEDIAVSAYRAAEEGTTDSCTREELDYIINNPDKFSELDVRIAELERDLRE